MMLLRHCYAYSGTEETRHDESTVIEGERRRKLLVSRHRLIVFGLASLVE